MGRQLEPYSERGVSKVIVAAPVKDERALNVVVGVNDHLYDPDVHDVVTELQAKLDGPAVRVPLLNASLTDCVLEVSRPTDVGEVNRLLEAAAAGPLQRILGYETGPLVSIDFKDDSRSAVADAPSTMVTGSTQVKVLAWYDNEWGYANRLVDLARQLASTLPAPRRPAPTTR